MVFMHPRRRACTRGHPRSGPRLLLPRIGTPDGFTGPVGGVWRSSECRHTVSDLLHRRACPPRPLLSPAGLCFSDLLMRAFSGSSLPRSPLFPGDNTFEYNSTQQGCTASPGAWPTERCWACRGVWVSIATPG